MISQGQQKVNRHTCICKLLRDKQQKDKQSVHMQMCTDHLYMHVIWLVCALITTHIWTASVHNTQTGAARVRVSSIAHKATQHQQGLLTSVWLLQVLSPIKQGAMGTEELNSVLQDIFNPNDTKGPKALPKAELQLRHKRGLLRVGDRVTHLKNDTQLDVYNGDQGYVERITYRGTASSTVTVRYPPRVRRGLGSSSNTSGSDSDADSRVDDSGGFHRVTYGDADILDMLQLSWATTVHKVSEALAGGTRCCKVAECHCHTVAECNG